MTERSDYEEEKLDRLCYRGATNRQIIELVEAARGLSYELEMAMDDKEYFDRYPPTILRTARQRLDQALKKCEGIKA